MPTKSKKSSKGDIPSTLQRSPKKAQRTYEETLESAEKTYDGNEGRAHRAAWSAVKHSFEKEGDHWEPKSHKGPSDSRAASGGPNPKGKSYGGVDVEGKTTYQLMNEARKLGANVTTQMRNDEVAKAI
jgi:cation transport regulator ChaB